MVKLKNLSLLNIAWIAGIMEGEGTFGITNSNSPFWAIQMTDKDVIDKIQMTTHSRLYGPYGRNNRPSHHKPIYRVSLYGNPAISWMMTVYWFMGERRKNKIKFIIEKWKSCRSISQWKKNTTLNYENPTIGH